MMTFTVKNGTPKGSKSLCERCRHACISRGFSESQSLVRCGALANGTMLLDQRIRWPVSDCTRFEDKAAPTLGQMQDIALVVDVERVRVKGFKD